MLKVAVVFVLHLEYICDSILMYSLINQWQKTAF